MQDRAGALLLIASMLSVPLAFGAQQDEAWDRLQHVTHRGVFNFVVRQALPSKANCVKGRIETINADAVKVRPYQGAAVTIARPNLAYVSDDDGPIYLGGSSWSMVKGWGTKWVMESARVVTRSGKTYAGEVARVSDSEIVLVHSNGKSIYAGSVARIDVLPEKSPNANPDPGGGSWKVKDWTLTFWERVRIHTTDDHLYEGRVARVNGGDIFLAHGKKETIARSDVSRVYYLRIKPMSESLSYASYEAGPLLVLDPEAWPYLLRIGVGFAALIYDSAIPEDDPSTSCIDAP